MINLEKKYYVNVGANGTFAESGKYYTSAGDVEGIFDFLKEKEVEKLVVYFHGGLVNEDNGMGSAEFMKNYFADLNSKRHVVSFVWETGVMETFTQNYKKVLNEDWIEEAVKFVIKLVAKKLNIVDARGSGVYLSDILISEEKQNTEPFEFLDKTLGARGGSSFFIDNEEENRSNTYKKLFEESKNLIKNEGTENIKKELADNETEARGGFLYVAMLVAQIAFAVLKRYYKNTHHDFYPTIMEETIRKISLDKVGNWGWSQMKNKAADMFKSNVGLTGDNLYAGSYFLSLLDKHIQSLVNDGKSIEIELVGHSAGSIAICNLLEAIGERYKNIRFNNVFFLAPACRTDLFLEKYKMAKENGLFKKFKMFTMKEEFEKRDHCLPFVYTHSLLYLVSGLFEDEVDAKIMGLHEQFSAKGRYSGFDELKKLNLFLKNNSLVLSVDDDNLDEKMRSKAIKHGNFDNDDVTLLAILRSI